jgi:hypothetical protein
MSTTSQSRRRLRHAIYTNLPGTDGTGLRLTTVGGWTTDARRKLEDWLAAVRPAAGHDHASPLQSAFAVAAHGLDGGRYIGLAVARSSGLDEHGRPGVRLVHAFLAEVLNADPLDHLAALYAHARSLPPVDVTSIDQYIVTHCAATEIECLTVDLGAIAMMDDDRLARVLSVAEQKQKGNFSLAVRPDEDIVALVIGALGALPPRLRLGIMWSVGSDDVYPGRRFFPCQPGGESTGAHRGTVGVAYPKWLRLRIAAGDDASVRAMSQNWSIASWREFADQLTVATWEAQRAPSVSARTESPSSPTVEPPLPATDLDDQYRAMQESLVAYVDSRLAGVAPERRLAAAGAPLWRRVLAWLTTYRADVYALLALIWIVAHTMTEPAPSRAPVNPAPKTAPAAQESPATIDPPPSGAAFALDSAESRLARLHGDTLASWLTAIARAEGIDSTRVSPKQRDYFSRLAATVTKGVAPSRSDQVNMRIGLFEYVYGLWERSHRREHGPSYRITLAFHDYDPALLDALCTEALPRRTCQSRSPEDPQVQAAVVLAFMRQHPRR